jgi:hypothetical protein
VSFVSTDSNDIGRGQSRQFTSTSEDFAILTDQNSIDVTVREAAGTRWFLQLAAPPGERLQQGTYEILTPVPGASLATRPRGAYLSFSGGGLGCNGNPVGRFTVRTAIFGSDRRISRFEATFEQRCLSSPTPLRGDVLIVESGTAGGTGRAPDISGVWSGRLENPVFVPVEVQINQVGATIDGSWSVATAGWQGRLTGSIEFGALSGTATFEGEFPFRSSQRCESSLPVTAFVSENLTELVISSRLHSVCPYQWTAVLQQRTR